MPSRFLIGIDLGTTNSVLAYVDTQKIADTDSVISVFPVPQLVAPGEVRTLPVLPSFLYFPTDEELSGSGVVATWNEQPPMVTGALAREQGALVPSRQVSSAKSWLSYPGVRRRAKILPVQAEPTQPMISPVEASARYLMHLRDAWDGAMGTGAETRFERQEIVLTVPGSFDEEARELTIEAAQRAGLNNLTLLEEPLAAFYAWIAANPLALTSNGEELRDGELILICDIGGGTSDFSLIRVLLIDGQVQFERIAIGDHLLLGGDNLDLALARCAENKLEGNKLTMRQRYALRRACCAAKERLLSDSALHSVPLAVLGSGQAIVGQALSTDLTREEVLRILTDGFLPITAANEMPSTRRLKGLRELGLPYPSDPAITKHLAAFLRQAAVGITASHADRRMVRPDAVLFNGGFCASVVSRDRIVEAISAWFGGARREWRPELLNNESVDSAVARGAAYYGQVRRGKGLRIRAGCARTYYIGLPSQQGIQGACILPSGAEEGTTFPLLNRDFSVLANRPVSFTLYSSRTRRDAHGEVIALDEADVHRHPPLVTLLRYGKRMRDVYLTVGLRASFTEIGKLELWCESRETPHRWRLQFELREEEVQAQQFDRPKPPPLQKRSSAAVSSNAKVESAAGLIDRVFGGPAEDVELGPEALVRDMEEMLGVKRNYWPTAVIRRFTDVLLEFASGRKRSPSHEMRWLNLVGFCLRPGFGATGDQERVRKLRASASDLAFPEDLRCQVAALVLLRRIAGGINASEQQALYRKYATSPGTKKKRLNRQLEAEQWRLIASLEHLLAGTRVKLGNELLSKIKREPGDAMSLWSLGRLGARVPLYGPLHCVIGAEVAAEWLKVLLDLPSFTTATASAIVLIARRIADRSRDIEEAIREQVISRLITLRISEELIQLLSKCVSPERADAVRSFGESLPPDLHLVSSTNCLLSVPVFHASGASF
jgi:molecular chaperone DnaK (HSP70)